MKNLLKALLLLLLAVYLALAVTIFNNPEARQLCTAVDVTVEDSAVAGFITPSEIRALLCEAKAYPVGRKIKDVNCARIESVLSSNPFIDDITCYKTQGGHVFVTVTQRLPVMRVISDNGENYYIDTRGKIMPRMHYSADLAVATGCITQKYAHAKLLPLGRLLKYDKFWDSQIEQIHVDSAGNIELFPRIGSHTVYIGKPEALPQKLKRLKTFYSQVLNQVGWNKYSRINLEYDNQIICKK